jgi:uncharacterized membrane protein YkvA (DUF1232 family)
MPVIAELKARARRLKTEVAALVLAVRHPGTPWYAKLFLVAIIAYALSPIDLIPDFIPVLGLVDDIILLPFAIVLAVKMIPAGVMAECRSRASQLDASGSRIGRIGAAFILLLWLALIVLAALWAHNSFAHERPLPGHIGRPDALTAIEPSVSTRTFARYSFAFAASPAFCAALAAPAVAPSRWGSFFSVASKAASASA